MAQVKDVPRATAHAGHEGPGLLFHRGPVGAEDDGIQVSLERRDAQRIPGFREGRAPIKRQHVGPQGLHLRGQGRITGTEVHHGHRIGAGLERGDEALGVGQGEVLEVRWAERTYPGIKKLYGLHTRFDLLPKVGSHRVHELVHEHAPSLRGVIHQTLTVNVVPGAAAFDRVGGQSEGGAGKANEGNVGR